MMFQPNVILLHLGPHFTLCIGKATTTECILKMGCEKTS